MRFTRWACGSILILYALWLGVCWYLSEQFLSLGIVDYVESEELEILDGFQIAGLNRRAVDIRGEGVSLSASFFEHPNPANCAVILLPGIGGYRTQVLPALPMFWSRGCHVLAYDPRGTGASERVSRTFGYFEKKDNAAIIRWIEAETDLTASRIGIWGPSFGAAVGILTLDEIEPLGFVIADSTFSSFEQVVRDTIALLSSPIVARALTPGVIQLLERRTGMDANKVVPQESVSGITTPMLLIHAKEDPAMDISHTERVFEARTSDTTLFEITDWGAGHADSAIVDPVSYQKLVHSFLGSSGF